MVDAGDQGSLESLELNLVLVAIYSCCLVACCFHSCSHCVHAVVAASKPMWLNVALHKCCRRKEPSLVCNSTGRL